MSVQTVNAKCRFMVPKYHGFTFLNTTIFDTIKNQIKEGFFLICW